jgi:hypothetical protein
MQIKTLWSYFAAFNPNIGRFKGTGSDDLGIWRYEGFNDGASPTMLWALLHFGMHSVSKRARSHRLCSPLLSRWAGLHSVRRAHLLPVGQSLTELINPIY